MAELTAPVPAMHLHLLGTWSLTVEGAARHVQIREQRLLALLGLRGPQSRVTAAGLLWPDSREDRARASLRTSLVRIRQELGDAVRTGRDQVGIDGVLSVDVDSLRTTLERVEATPREALNSRATLSMLRSPDLLFGWYDEWVLAERERLRHRRVRALVRLAQVSLEVGRAAEAVEFAEEAAELEPLLESAVTLLIRALLQVDDLTAALEVYRGFRDRLRLELGVSPPAALTAALRAAKERRMPARRL